MAFTLKQLEELKAAGKIKGYSAVNKPVSNIPKNIPLKKRSKTKEWITLVLGKWCFVHKLELWHSGNERGEYKFDKERKFRFDFCIPELKLAIEYEGLMSAKSRHTTISGYTMDTEKYNLAASQGWIVYRYTAANYKQLERDLAKFKK